MPDCPLQSWFWNGDAFIPCAHLPLADRGFRYGMALFESLRVIGGTALFLTEHLERLRIAAAQREFPVAEAALSAIAPLLLSAGRDGFGRIYLTAGDGSPADPVTESRLFLLLEDRPAPSHRPLRLALSPQLHHPLFGGLKTGNYWSNLDALQQAKSRGCDEALLFNEHGELVSAATANVFLVQDRIIRTPGLACGARDGVTRSWVLSQTPVREKSLFLQDVQDADEIFLTNSWIGISSATCLEHEPIRSLETGTRLTIAYGASFSLREAGRIVHRSDG